MRDCKLFQDRFVEALYDELPTSLKGELEAHLDRCASCASDYERMGETLEFMDHRQRPLPGSSYWAEFDAALQARLKGEARPQLRILPGGGRPRPPASNSLWMLRIAASLALVAVGVVIGRFYLSPGPSIDNSGQTDLSAAANPSSDLGLRVEEYFDRTQTLLVGFDNLDPLSDGADALDLRPQKITSRELVRQTEELKKRLSGERQQRLLELISQLQVILIQIANLESDQSLQGIEIIQERMRHQGLLLEIRLERLRPSIPSDSASRKSI